MAKAPQSGRSKTRLCPPLTADQAASLSAAFLRDTTDSLARAARSAPITPTRPLPRGGRGGRLPIWRRTALVLADGSAPAPTAVAGFGRCLLQAIQGMLDRGHAAACVLSSDVTTLPTRLLVEAARTLARAGRSGRSRRLRRRRLLPPRPQAGPCPPVCRHRLEHRHRRRRDPGPGREIGLDLVELEPWYDIDDAASLCAALRRDRRLRRAGDTVRLPRLARASEAVPA